MSGSTAYALIVGAFVAGVIIAVLWPDIRFARDFCRRQRERWRS